MRNDYDISDAEYERQVKPFYELVDCYVQDNVIYDYIAFYLASKFVQGVMWKNNLNAHIREAIEYLCEVRNIDITKVNSILKKKYSLEIVNTAPLEIKKS